MKSEIATRIKLKYEPIAILFSNEKPQDALEFTEGRWGCAVAMLTAAAKGRTAVFSRTTYGCPGGGMGLGLTEQFPEGFENFLSTGNEAFKKTPELVRDFMDTLPLMDIPEQYVVFKPLQEIELSEEDPRVIVFYANPDQLSALFVLANYGRIGTDNVISPFASGCQSVCLIPVNEAKKQHPSAVIGMLDIAARQFIDEDLLTFSVPFSMFREMEDNVQGSFLDKPEWNKLAKRI